MKPMKAELWAVGFTDGPYLVSEWIVPSHGAARRLSDRVLSYQSSKRYAERFGFGVWISFDYTDRKGKHRLIESTWVEVPSVGDLGWTP